MQGSEDIVAVRREILDLLRQQMAVLDSPSGVTDTQLTKCYQRQLRVQELRERLQAATAQFHSEGSQMSTPPVAEAMGASPGTSASL